MPLVKINVIENVFTPDQKATMIEKVTDAMVEVEGEAMRGVTWVVVADVKEGSWGIGGRGLTSEDVRRIQAGAP
jgi:4-oxalocrotonate tautomerase